MVRTSDSNDAHERPFALYALLVTLQSTRLRATPYASGASSRTSVSQMW